MSIESAIKEVLREIGEDPNRNGLKKTPKRVEDMYDELMSGYKESPEDAINNAVYDLEYDEMVVVKDIEFYSLCEHHMLPFFGKCNVAYIPNGKVVGLSKIPRIVEVFTRRLQVQERLTVEIADFLNKTLEPSGVAVVINGYHLCMAMRGVKKAEANMVTSSMLGTFRKDERTRSEFFNLIKN